MPPDEIENPYSVDQWDERAPEGSQSIPHGTFNSKREACLYAIALSHQNQSSVYRVRWATGGGEPQPCVFVRNGVLTNDKGKTVSLDQV